MTYRRSAATVVLPAGFIRVPIWDWMPVLVAATRKERMDKPVAAFRRDD